MMIKCTQFAASHFTFVFANVRHEFESALTLLSNILLAKKYQTLNHGNGLRQARVV